MIFVTVGTVLPFNRLIRAVDDAIGCGVIDEPVFAQIGPGGRPPRNMEWAEMIDREHFEDCVNSARALIAHAGTGTIFAALVLGKPLLILPRLASSGEHVNDHQVATAEHFHSLGHVLAADNEEEIARLFPRLASFVPAPRMVRREPVVERVRVFLDAVAAGGRGRGRNSVAKRSGGSAS